jgi:hypothetical protein
LQSSWNTKVDAQSSTEKPPDELNFLFELFSAGFGGSKEPSVRYGRQLEA